MIEEPDFEGMIAAALDTMRAEAAQFLLPVIVLLAWTLFMWLWMYATRIPAMQRAKLKPQDFADNPADARAELPTSATRVADNYNHLHEQPTVFYGVMLVLALVQPTSEIAHMLGWAYTGLRIAHSLVQATVNHILTRFTLFTLSSFVLFGLVGITIGAALAP